MAASMPSGGGIDFGELPPESTEFSFPLYLNITEFSYAYGGELEYIREGDEIVNLLKEWFLDNCTRNNYYSELELTENTQIYINGSPITTLRKPNLGSEIQFEPAPSPFSSVYLDEDALWGYIDN